MEPMRDRAWRCLLCFVTAGLAIRLPAAEDPWRAWLAEVAPIIGRLERQTFLALGTDEDRRRFQEMFWRVRDPRPETPENEFQAEFRRRTRVAEERYDGIRSDRGRMYVLLGKPLEIRQYTGIQDLVECQTWAYHNTEHPHLPPFLTLLFYRPRDSGGYELFTPGLQGPADLLAPQWATRALSRSEAYRTVAENSPELAQASLSIVPGEGDPRTGNAVSSSAAVLGEIARLPEREDRSGYLQRFGPPRGTVATRDSTRRIMGTVNLTVGAGDGYATLHVAALPDHLAGKALADGGLAVAASLHLTLESPEGAVIYRGEQRFDLSLERRRKDEIDARKVVFVQQIPVIEGSFRVFVTWINHRSEEFFSRQAEIEVTGDAPRLLAGFAARAREPRTDSPFALGGTQLTVDPRFVYTQRETLTGAVAASPAASLTLQSDAAGVPARPIPLRAGPGGGLTFSLPLREVAPGGYRLTLLDGGRRAAPLPVRIEPGFLGLVKPLVLAPPAGSGPDPARFVLAQEYFNAGDPARAVALFDRLTTGEPGAAARLVMARAYAAAKRPERVLELLAPLPRKEYAAWVLLTNAAIDLGRTDQVVEGLLRLRGYGDTASLNRSLAAAYLSQGKTAAAAACRRRAEELERRDRAAGTP